MLAHLLKCTYLKYISHIGSLQVETRNPEKQSSERQHLMGNGNHQKLEGSVFVHFGDSGFLHKGPRTHGSSGIEESKLV